MKYSIRKDKAQEREVAQSSVELQKMSQQMDEHNLSEPKKHLQMDRPKMPSMQSFYQSDTYMKLQIGQKTQEVAIPSANYPFYKSIPLILLSIVKQVHVLYLIGITPFLLLKYEWTISFQILIIQVSLTLAYISIEFIARALTFQHYIGSNVWQEEGEYWVWDFSEKEWVKRRERDIKVGEIVRIQAEKSQETELAQERSLRRALVPVNMLPIRTHSKSKHVEVDTFETNKIEVSRKVPIISHFANYMEKQGEVIKGEISDCSIEFTFESSMGQSLEAKVCMAQAERGVDITNEDIIHRGTYFLNESSVIGVALLTTEEKKIKYLKEVLSGRNKIANFLQNHILYTIVINIFLVWALIMVVSVIGKILTGETFEQQFHWIFFNYFSTLCFSLNIIMFLVIGLYQILDSFVISRKFGFKMNNFIKSIDEFGMADTFLMDEFTFVQKNMLEVAHLEIMDDCEIDQLTILCIVQKSAKFHAKFSKQWLSLLEYKRAHLLEYKNDGRHSDQIRIKDEAEDFSGSIRIVVEVGDEHYKLRFNEKIILSALESIQFERQLILGSKIEQGNENGQLMLMVQILKLKHDNEMSLSVPISSEEDFKFCALINFRFKAQPEATKFFKYLKNKFNIFIMTESPFEYFEKVLISTGLKSKRGGKDEVLIFEEADEEDFYKKLKQRFSEFEHADQQQTEYSEREELWVDEKHEGGDLILALDASLIGYLGRTSIRELLKKISKRCTFMIIFKCSQFQKELCAANIVKIFPDHIFLSNFAVDQQIFKMANLSVSIKSHSGAHLATATVKSYEALQQFISVESVKSIEITTLIIKNHIFKNQCLTWSLFTALVLVYQGGYYVVGMEYSTFMFFLFNMGFTSFPLVFYLIFRPQLIADIAVEDLKSEQLRYEHLKGMFVGVLLTYVNYSLLPYLEMPSLFFAVAVNSTLAGNLYYLAIDDSVTKKWQLGIILCQNVFSLGLYFLSQFVPLAHELFCFSLMITPLPEVRSYLYCLILVLNPLLVVMLLFFFSFHRSIITKHMRALKKEQEDKDIDMDGKNEIVARIGRSSGMGMRFRIYDQPNTRPHAGII